MSNIENANNDSNVIKATSRGKPITIIGTILLGLAFIIPPLLIFVSNFLPEFDSILFDTFYIVFILGVFGLLLIVIGSYLHSKEENL